VRHRARRAADRPAHSKLDERLNAARRLADQGIIVGFHFHPMIHYADWKADYSALLSRVEQGFDPAEVALVSFGTLTFTKSVIRRIRNSGGKTRILQMPLTASDGKLSYPEATKLAMRLPTTIRGKLAATLASGYRRCPRTKTIWCGWIWR